MNLVGCVNDALDMKRILIERFDFKEDEIRVLLNHDATKEAILKGFRWLIRETVPQDWVIFSFSGHGKQLPDKNGDEEDGYDECICPSDVEPKYLLNLISDDEINQFVAKLKDRRAFFPPNNARAAPPPRTIAPTASKIPPPPFFGASPTIGFDLTTGRAGFFCRRYVSPLYLIEYIYKTRGKIPFIDYFSRINS